MAFSIKIFDMPASDVVGANAAMYKVFDRCDAQSAVVEVKKREVSYILDLCEPTRRIFCDISSPKMKREIQSSWGLFASPSQPL
jgi:hypothetical protein